MVDRERGVRAASVRDDVVLGRAMRQLHEARALSEEALARRLAVPSTFVARLECGERGARWRSLRKILRVLEATPQELVAAIAREESATPQS